MNLMYARIGYFVVYALFYGGLLFHKSWLPHVFGLYSYKYAFVLIAALIPFLFPWLLERYRYALGSWRAVGYAFVPMAIVGTLVYIGAEKYYYATREYPFHPFLQLAPASFENMPKEKPTDTIRIIALGGSTTDQSWLSERDRYTTHLQVLLEKQNGMHVEVLNGGRDWYTSAHMLIAYALYASDWNPDIVLVFEGINDLYRSCSPARFAAGAYRSDYGHFYGPAVRAFRPPTFESRFFSEISRRWFSLTRFDYKEIDEPVSFFPSIEAFRRNLTKLARLTRADGRTIVFATQPFFYKDRMTDQEKNMLWFGRKFCLREDGTYPSPLSLKAAMEAFNAAIKEVAMAEKIPLVDFAEAIPQNIDYFRDDVHLTAKGAARMAELMAEALNARIIKSYR